MLKSRALGCFALPAAVYGLLYGCHARPAAPARMPLVQTALFSLPTVPEVARPAPLPSTVGTRFSVTQIQAGRIGFLRLQFVLGGRLLALVTQNTILFWDMDANRIARRFELPDVYKDKTRLSSGVLSSDGRCIICFGVSADLTKTQGYVWDLQTGRLVRTLDAPDAATPSMAVSPDGSLLAVQEPNRDIRVENTADGRNKRVLSGLQYETGGNMAFSHDGKRLACVDRNIVSGGEPAHGEDDILVWDVTARHLLHTFHSPDDADQLAFSPDNKMLAVGCNHWTRSLYVVMCCFVEGGEQDVTPIADHGDEGGDAHYSGMTALADDAELYFSAIGNDAKITRLRDGKRFPLPPGSWEQSGVALSPAGTLLARNEGSGIVTLWRLLQQ